MALCENCLRDFSAVKCTTNESGRHHSFDNKPAFQSRAGSKFWYKDGHFHRTDGPAMEWHDGYREWYLNGRQSTSMRTEIVVGKTVRMGDNVATVLKHVEGCFYEVLLGNKKILIAKI